MWKKWIAGALLSMMAIWGLAACETMGRATGETAEEVEEGAQEFERGYEKGRVPDR